jgi:hypothetical protein
LSKHSELAAAEHSLATTRSVFGDDDPRALRELVSVVEHRCAIEGVTLQSVVDLERAFDGLLHTTWTQLLGTLFDNLARRCRDIGDADRIAPREEMLLNLGHGSWAKTWWGARDEGVRIAFNRCAIDAGLALLPTMPVVLALRRRLDEDGPSLLRDISAFASANTVEAASLEALRSLVGPITSDDPYGPAFRMMGAIEHFESHGEADGPLMVAWQQRCDQRMAELWSAREAKRQKT